jgi:hypothetical protein
MGESLLVRKAGGGAKLNGTEVEVIANSTIQAGDFLRWKENKINKIEFINEDFVTSNGNLGPSPVFTYEGTNLFQWDVQRVEYDTFAFIQASTSNSARFYRAKTRDLNNSIQVQPNDNHDLGGGFPSTGNVNFVEMLKDKRQLAFTYGQFGGAITNYQLVTPRKNFTAQFNDLTTSFQNFNNNVSVKTKSTEFNNFLLIPNVNSSNWSIRRFSRYGHIQSSVYADSNTLQILGLFDHCDIAVADYNGVPYVAITGNANSSYNYNAEMAVFTFDGTDKLGSNSTSRRSLTPARPLGGKGLKNIVRAIRTDFLQSKFYWVYRENSSSNSNLMLGVSQQSADLTSTKKIADLGVQLTGETSLPVELIDLTNIGFFPYNSTEYNQRKLLIYPDTSVANNYKLKASLLNESDDVISTTEYSLGNIALDGKIVGYHYNDDYVILFVSFSGSQIFAGQTTIRKIVIKLTSEVEKAKKKHPSVGVAKTGGTAGQTIIMIKDI